MAQGAELLLLMRSGLARNRLLQRGALLYILLAVVLLVAFILYMNLSGAGIIHRAANALEADGLPANAAELATWPEGGAAHYENGRRFLAACESIVKAPYEQRGSWPYAKYGVSTHSRVQLNDETLTAMAGYLALNAQALEEISALRDALPARYAFDWTENQWKPPAYEYPLHKASGLLRLAIAYHAATGDGAACARHAECFFALAESLSSEPYGRAFNMRSEILAGAVDALQQPLVLGLWDESQIEALRERVRRLIEKPSYYYSLVGEQAITMIAYDNGAYSAFDVFMYRDAFDSHFATAQWWMSHRGDSYAQAKRAAQMLFDSMHEDSLHTPYCMTRQLTRFRQHMRAEARLRTANAALAVEAFRLEHGRLPDTLEEAGIAPPEAALDPFDANPLRYLRDGEGFSVYSIGEDLEDDGSTPELSFMDQQWTGDLTFAVMREAA